MMMIAPTERYTPPFIAFISVLISFTSFRSSLRSDLDSSDLFIFLISSKRWINCCVRGSSVLVVLGEELGTTMLALAGNAITTNKANDRIRMLNLFMIFIFKG
jgi:hypothetical protein